MILYNAKASIERDNSFVITKFDEDMNIESSYTTSLSECECPAGVRPTCRHRQMLPHFIAGNKVDTDFFFCYDDQTWHRPFESVEEGEGEAELEHDLDDIEGAKIEIESVTDLTQGGTIAQRTLTPETPLVGAAPSIEPSVGSASLKRRV